MMQSASEATPLRRVVMASLIGTTIEWYDFFLYGSAAALVFNKLFFPEFDPLTGASLTFDRGSVVEGVEPAIAGELEDRGLVEVLGAA